MSNTRARKLLLGALILIGLVQPLIFFPFLPERVASHFDAAGEPDGWMDRGGFVAFSCIMTLICGPMMVAIGCAIRSSPAGLINLPNKAWWLAPEREVETRAWMFDHFLEFTCATLGFLNAILFMALLANLRAEPHIGGFWLLLAMYLGWTTIWLVRLWRRFRLPPGNLPDQQASSAQ